MSKVESNQDGECSWSGLTKIATVAATLVILFIP